MKLIIDIPDEAYDILTEYQVLPENIDLEYFVIHGIPLEDIKVEIEKEMGKLKGNSGCDYFTNNTIDNCIGVTTRILDKHIRESKQ